MKRKLTLANLVLVALCAAGVLYLRREWTAERAREQQVLQNRLAPVPPLPYRPLPPIAPARAADYSDIAQKMLFSKDRNPIVVVEPPPVPKAKPMPPLPLFHGVMDLGDGPMAIMSLGSKGLHRDYRAGDKVGDFTLVAVNNDELVLDWEGQTITKKVEEMLDRSTAAPPTPGPAAPAAKPAAPPPELAKMPATPGGDISPGIKACQQGDTSPDGTVTDGMRKVLKRGPFGNRCYWESAK